MTTNPESSPARRPRLVRTRRGRLIGGVCSGLGAHFNVDPILFRIAFVGLAIFSGLGLGLYLVLLLLVAEEGAERAPIFMWRSSWRTILGVIVVLFALAIAFHAAAHTGSGGWRFGVGVSSLALVGLIAWFVRSQLRRPVGAGGHISADRRLFGFLALVVVVVAAMVLSALLGGLLAGTHAELAAWAVAGIGAVLVVSAFAGGVRWLLLPALTFALAVAVISAAHVNLNGGFGERIYRPHTVSEVAHGYELGAGRLEVDLRGVSFPVGDTPLHVRLGMGELVILVPPGVCIATSAKIGGGYVGALEYGSGGLDVDWSNRPLPPQGTPRLVVDGHVGLGALFVANPPFGSGWDAPGGPIGSGGWNGWGGWGGRGRVTLTNFGSNEACSAHTAVSR